MRIILALVVLAACGNSAPPPTADAPVSPHLVVACGAEWAESNAMCEAACEHNTDASEVGPMCHALVDFPNDGFDPVPVECAGTFSFQGVAGCCETATGGGASHLFAVCD